MASTVDQVYRDYNTSGVPASGDYKPKKPEIRALLKQIQNGGGLAVTRNTFTALSGVTPPTEDYMGVVLDDPDATKNGYYSRVAAVWVWERGFPDTFAAVTPTGSGTVQTATVSAGVNPADILVFYAVVVTENTGPLTLALAGGSALDVVNAAGSPLSAGEWSGVVLFFLNEDGDYQLINDAGAAAAAAASATDAETAQAAAELAAAQAAASAALSGPTGVALKSFSGDGATTAFTLDAEPTSSAHIIVAIEGQLQEPETAYTVSGFTLTFAEPPPALLDDAGDPVNNISTRIVSIADGSDVPPDLSVTTAKLAALSVTEAKLGDKAVTYAKIQDVSATDKLLGRSTGGAGVIEEITCTAAGRALLDDVDAAAQRTTLDAQQRYQFVDVELSAPQSIPDDIYDLVEWNAENSDDSGLYNTGNYRVTLTRSGLVKLSANVLILGGTLTVGNNAILELRRNGAAIKTGRTIAAITGNVTVPLNTQFKASAGDYLELYVKVKGTSLTLSAADDSWLNVTIL